MIIMIIIIIIIIIIIKIITADFLKILHVKFKFRRECIIAAMAIPTLTSPTDIYVPTESALVLANQKINSVCRQ